MSANLHFRDDRRVWEIRFTQHGVEWRQSIGTDKATAAAACKLANQRMDQGENLVPLRLRTSTGTATAADSVRVVGAQWLREDWENRKASTNDFYEGNFRRQIVPALGDKPIKAITREVCATFVQSLKTKKSKKSNRLISRSTREGIHATLTAFLAYAVSKGLITTNPAIKLEKKYFVRPDELDPKIVVWTATEVERFLAACRTHRPDYYALFFVAVRSGLRLGELIELRWDDLELEGTIYVQRAYTQRKRTALTVNADGTYTREAIADDDQITSPKGKRSRFIEHDDREVTRVLAWHRTRQRAAALKHGEPAPALVFTGPQSRKRLQAQSLTRVIRAVAKIAKVSPLGMHGLRHTFASLNLMSGIPMDEISRELGHKDQTTTDRKYRHFVRGTEAQRAERRRRRAEVWATDKAGGGES